MKTDAGNELDTGVNMAVTMRKFLAESVNMKNIKYYNTYMIKKKFCSIFFILTLFQGILLDDNIIAPFHPFYDLRRHG